MKLYASTQSDRATKGQGGNRFVRTVFTVEHDTKEREEVAVTEIEKGDNGYTVRHVPTNGDATVYHVPIKR